MAFIKIDDPSQYLSPIAWGWLSYKSSLTTRLREFTNQAITFHLLHEAWNTVDNQLTWIRQIQWQLHQIGWIDATIFIPKSSINAETKCLLYSHERPIGEQLFQEPSLTRSDFDFFQPVQNSLIWIRESVFQFKQQPLTLRETFLPLFFEAIES